MSKMSTMLRSEMLRFTTVSSALRITPWRQAILRTRIAPTWHRYSTKGRKIGHETANTHAKDDFTYKTQLEKVLRFQRNLIAVVVMVVAAEIFKIFVLERRHYNDIQGDPEARRLHEALHERLKQVRKEK